MAFVQNFDSIYLQIGLDVLLEAPDLEEEAVIVNNIQ